jgi:hypothetical protein
MAGLRFTGPCTCTLRLNTAGSLLDCYKNKKAWTRGLAWLPSGPLPPGDAFDAGHVTARRLLRPPPRAASSHRGLFTPLRAVATAGRERAAPHAASRPGR